MTRGRIDECAARLIAAKQFLEPGAGYCTGV